MKNNPLHNLVNKCSGERRTVMRLGVIASTDETRKTKCLTCDGSGYKKCPLCEGKGYYVQTEDVVAKGWTFQRITSISSCPKWVHCPNCNRRGWDIL